MKKGGNVKFYFCFAFKAVIYLHIFFSVQLSLLPSRHSNLGQPEIKVSNRILITNINTLRCMTWKKKDSKDSARLGEGLCGRGNWGVTASGKGKKPERILWKVC